MAFTSWLRAFNSHRTRFEQKSTGLQKKRSSLLRLEQLEDRLAPAQLVFNGGWEQSTFAGWSTEG